MVMDKMVMMAMETMDIMIVVIDVMMMVAEGLRTIVA